MSGTTSKPPASGHRSMARGILSFGGMTMLSRVFGLVRDRLIGHYFGANAMTDAFFVAFRIPNFMRRLFAEGSFSTAFVPVFTEIKEKRSHAELKELMARTAGTLGGVLLVVTAIGMLASPWLAALFSNHAEPVPGQQALIVRLLLLTFPFLLFVSLTALAAGALNSYHRFGLPAFTPIILNLCMIAGSIWGSKIADPPIMALGWAVLAGGILQLLFQFPQLAQLDLLTLPRWGWNHPQVRRIMRLMIPTLFGSSIAQLNLLLDTIVISLLATGSQTWMYQATRFLELPLGVFGVALGTVILPALSRHHVAEDGAGFSRALDWGLRTTLLIAVPAMCALLILAEPLVATFFQNGEYTAFDTHMTAIAIIALGAGVPAIALTRTLLPAFYARQDTKTPVRAGIIALVVNMAFNFILIAALFEAWAPADLKQMPWLDGIARLPGLHIGLAIASSVSNWLQFALLWRYLKRAGVYSRQPGWAAHWLRLGFASVAMLAVLIAGVWLWQDWTTVRIATRGWHLAVLVAAAAIVYVGALFASGFRMRDLQAT